MFPNRIKEARISQLNEIIKEISYRDIKRDLKRYIKRDPKRD